MAPLSLKIILDEGAVTRTVMFESNTTVAEAQAIIKEKILTADDGKEYVLFLTSADNPLAGIWLEPRRPLDYYMLRDGDCLYYLDKSRNLRVRMLDGSVKTLQVDESKNIGDLMFFICSKIGITNHDEYGLCHEEAMEQEESKENKPATGTLTLKRKAQQKERDAKMTELSKKLKSDDNVEWLDQHKTLRELGVDHKETLLLKRRLFYSDRNVDSRDPVQLNLLYIQTRDAILCGHHPVTENQAADCKVRWINIRDVNRRIWKQSIKKPGRTKLYKYESELSFMRPFYKDVLIHNEMESDEYNDHDDFNDNNDQTEAQNYDDDDAEKSDDDYKPVPKAKKNKTKTTLKRKRKAVKQREKDEEPVISVENVASSELDPKDPIDAFLLSIGATLKTFTMYHQNLVKSKIFNIVQDHELQQIVQRERPGEGCSDNEVKAVYLH